MKLLTRKPVKVVIVLASVALVGFILNTLGQRTRNAFVQVNTRMTSTDGFEPPAPAFSRSPGAETAQKAAGGSTSGVAYAATVPQKAQRLVIMNANVTLEVKQFQMVHSNLERVARELDGYVAKSQLNLPTAGAQTGAVTIRVPQERYDKALARIKRFGKLISEEQSAEDVTQKYVDTDARIRNMKAEEERILDIMRRARRRSRKRWRWRKNSPTLLTRSRMDDDSILHGLKLDDNGNEDSARS